MQPMSASTNNILESELNIGGGPIRVVVKDSIDVAGAVTGMGSAAFADREPAGCNAALVDHILNSSGRVIGKATMHELAYGVTGLNEYAGTPVNPRYPALIPGGSSSGSAAAVASGLADIGIGTDTGGSIRMPAACCGVVGLKPTFDRISREGVHPQASSLDCAGPFGQDVAAVERAMAMLDPEFQTSGDLSSFTLGVVRGAWSDEVTDTFDRFIEASGLDCKDVALPLIDEAHEAGLSIISAENWAAFGNLVDHPGLGPDIRARLKLSSQISASQLAQARDVQIRFRKEVDEVLDTVGALILPSLPSTAPTLEEARDPSKIVNHTRLLRPFNVSGHPAISLPFETRDGLPFGVQMVGKRMGDELLCAIAREVEEQIQNSVLKEKTT